MNKKEFKFLYGCLKGNVDSSVLTAADQLLMSELETKGLISGLMVTEAGKAALEPYKIDNAIILAAGMSTRFAPVCFDIAKGLLPVKGESLIERQIRQLREVGIQEIILVVGYRPYQFEELAKTYGLTLIYNPYYSARNNYYSVYLCRDYLRNTIITSSDLYFSKNLFEAYAYDAYYCSIFIEGETEERALVLDEEDRMIDTYYGDAHDVWVTLGHAYYSRRFSKYYKQIVAQHVDEPWIQNMFWADIQDKYLDKLYMYIKRCSREDIHEFDYLSELKEFDPEFKALEYSPTMCALCEYFQCSEDELTEFRPLLIKGTSKDSCTFRCGGKKYAYCTTELSVDTTLKKLIEDAAKCENVKLEKELDGFGTIWMVF